jgi:hypothetical protein
MPKNKPLKQSEQQSFKSKYSLPHQKAIVTAYAMVLDRELEKSYGKRWTKKREYVKERFNEIRKSAFSELMKWVKEFGPESAFDAYELVISHRYDGNLRGRKHNKKIPPPKQLLKEYKKTHSLIKDALSKSQNRGLTVQIIQQIFPEIVKEDLEKLFYIKRPPNIVAASILALRYSSSPGTIQNKLIAPRKIK